MEIGKERESETDLFPRIFSTLLTQRSEKKSTALIWLSFGYFIRFELKCMSRKSFSTPPPTVSLGRFHDFLKYDLIRKNSYFFTEFIKKIA